MADGRVGGVALSGRSPLHAAAAAGSLREVELLLAEGANIHCASKLVSDHGRLPLHLAVRGDHWKVTKALLQAGANPDTTDTQGFGPVHLAAQYGYVKIIGLLFKAHANLEHHDGRGLQAVHIAAANGMLVILRYLSFFGCDLTSKDRRQATALHHAAKGGDLEVVRWLVKKRVPHNLLDDQGKRPIDWAKENGNNQIQWFLTSLTRPTNLKKKLNVHYTEPAFGVARGYREPLSPWHYPLHHHPLPRPKLSVDKGRTARGKGGVSSFQPTLRRNFLPYFISLDNLRWNLDDLSSSSSRPPLYRSSSMSTLDIDASSVDSTLLGDETYCSSSSSESITELPTTSGKARVKERKFVPGAAQPTSPAFSSSPSSPPPFTKIFAKSQQSPSPQNSPEGYQQLNPTSPPQASPRHIVHQFNQAQIAHSSQTHSPQTPNLTPTSPYPSISSTSTPTHTPTFSKPLLKSPFATSSPPPILIPQSPSTSLTPSVPNNTPAHNTFFIPGQPVSQTPSTSPLYSQIPSQITPIPTTTFFTPSQPISQTQCTSSIPSTYSLDQISNPSTPSTIYTSSPSQTSIPLVTQISETKEKNEPVTPPINELLYPTTQSTLAAGSILSSKTLVCPNCASHSTTEAASGSSQFKHSSSYPQLSSAKAASKTKRKRRLNVFRKFLRPTFAPAKPEDVTPIETRLTREVATKDKRISNLVQEMKNMQMELQTLKENKEKNKRTEREEVKEAQKEETKETEKEEEEVKGDVKEVEKNEQGDERLRKDSSKSLKVPEGRPVTPGEDHTMDNQEPSSESGVLDLTMEPPFIQDQEGPNIYSCITNPRGKVLILNNINFHGNPQITRYGSEMDVINLERIFRRMGYQVQTYWDLTRERTLVYFQEASQDHQLKHVSALFVFILSHGEGYKTFLSHDREKVTLDEIRSCFLDRNCPHLRGKPKVFFSHFCRGSDDEIEVPIVPEAQLEAYKDMLCLYSTTEGFRAYRHGSLGTPFVRAWCTTLAKYSGSHKLDELIKIFQREYKELRGATTPEVQNFNFNKDFYFNPLRQ